MTLTIQYKTDGSFIPYCAYTTMNGEYRCEWSAQSFEAAKAALLCRIKKHATSIVPAPEVVEL